MLTWVVEQEDVDKNFTLKDLMVFSQKHNTRVIIKGFCEFKNGFITHLL